MSILIVGEICHQVKGVFKTQRLRKYGTLHDRSPESPPYIELYDSQDDYDDALHKNKKVDTKKIDLRQIKTVTTQTQATSKGKEYHLEVRTKKEKNNFLFDTENDSLVWGRYLKKLLEDSSDKSDEPSSSSVTALSDDDDAETSTINAMYGTADDVKKFEVNVESGDLAKLCNIEGTRNLLVNPTTIAFENLTTRKIDFTFQLAFLRRFGKKEGIFSFEVGRQCEKGPGNIKCKTDSASIINNMIIRQSNSRGTTQIPSMPVGIEDAQNRVQSAIEKQVNPDVPADTGISGPALHVQKRHPGLAKGPALIPLKQTRENDEEEISRDSQKRWSGKSDQGSVKHGPVTDQFAKQLDVLIDPHHKESVKMKDKDRESKKKESERKKEEKEAKKREEKEKKEMKEKEKKQKEQSKKDVKKGKEKIQPPAKVLPGGLYEEVDIIDRPPLSTHDVNSLQSHYSEPMIHADVNGDETADSATTEYSAPIKVKPSHIQAEYTDVKIVKGNAWKSHGRSEDEEHHEENYSKISSVPMDGDQGPPPIPGRGYEDQEEEEDLYNHIHLKTSLPNKQAQTENEYGTLSATKVKPLKDDVSIPEADYDESDSGESVHDDTYDVPDFDTYDAPTNVTKANSTKKAINSYEEATSKPSPKQKAPEESFYDEVT